MSAQLFTPFEASQYASLQPMQMTDLDEVQAIERTLYAFPWTKGNFGDSLEAGYSAWVLRDHAGLPGATIIGYFLLMNAVDEAHLLNVSIAAIHQGRGLGVVLLQKAAEIARGGRARSMILEVRPSNTRALSIYERFGFRRIGVRRGYYPHQQSNPSLREDAWVMRFDLP